MTTSHTPTAAAAAPSGLYPIPLLGVHEISADDILLSSLRHHATRATIPAYLPVLAVVLGVAWWLIAHAHQLLPTPIATGPRWALSVIAIVVLIAGILKTVAAGLDDVASTGRLPGWRLQARLDVRLLLLVGLVSWPQWESLARSIVTNDGGLARTELAELGARIWPVAALAVVAGLATLALHEWTGVLDVRARLLTAAAHHGQVRTCPTCRTHPTVTAADRDELAELDATTTSRAELRCARCGIGWARIDNTLVERRGPLAAAGCAVLRYLRTRIA